MTTLQRWGTDYWLSGVNKMRMKELAVAIKGKERVLCDKTPVS